MTGTATAALTELIPAPASYRASLVATAVNMGGLGLGPLIAGLFAQYAAHLTTLVFEVYLAVLAAAGLCLLFVPETVSPRQRPSSSPPCPSSPSPASRGLSRRAPPCGPARRPMMAPTWLPARTLRASAGAAATWYTRRFSEADNPVRQVAAGIDFRPRRAGMSGPREIFRLVGA